MPDALLVPHTSRSLCCTPERAENPQAGYATSITFLKCVQKQHYQSICFVGFISDGDVLFHLIGLFGSRLSSIHLAFERAVVRGCYLLYGHAFA